MREIIILSPGPFLKRDYDRFGVDVLKKNFIIKILDFTAWVNPILEKKYADKIYKCDEYLTISSKSDFLNFCSKVKSAIVLDFLAKNRKANWVRKHLKKKNSLFVDFNFNLTPVEKIKTTRLLDKLFLLVKNPKRFFIEFYNFIEKIFNNFIKVYHPDVLVVGGSLTSKKSKIQNQIYAHSMDYDVYLRLKDEPETKKTPYAVFLEDNMTEDLDYSVLNLLPPVNENEYFPILINFFKKFQLETGLKVKFAIHPKSFKNFSNLLKDFEYYKGNTAEIVKNSSLVFLHASTSLSYAVLFNKPAVFLTSNNLIKSWFGDRITNFSKSVDGKIINMDEDLENNIILKDLTKFNKIKYQQYKDNYLKFPNSPDIPLWEIFSKNICDIKK